MKINDVKSFNESVLYITFVCLIILLLTSPRFPGLKKVLVKRPARSYNLCDFELMTIVKNKADNQAKQMY